MMLCLLKHKYERQTWISDAGDYEDYRFLECDAVLSGRLLPTYQASWLKR
jgi:hypothetical protein